MNKKILKYVLKGLIAFGTANLLNGVSLKIVEQNQREPSAKKIQISVPVAKELAKNAEQPHKKAQDNMFVIAKKSSPVQTDTLSEKHRKNYQFPRIYQQVGPAKLERQKATNDIEQQNTDKFDCFSGSESSSPRYNNSDSNSHRSNSAEDEMLNQLIQGMLAQENSGTNHSTSGGAHSSPQNYSESTNPDPKKNIGPKSGPQKDTIKKDSPKQATNTQTTSTETIPTGIIEPGKDSENGELMQKAMKKLNKKNNKQEPEQKIPAEKTPAQTPANPNTPAQSVSDSPAAIPAELVECYNSFIETINSATPDAKIIDNFCVQSINWIAAAKKNTTDTPVQKSLADYKCFIEQQCAELDQATANIRAAKEGTEQEKNTVYQRIMQIRSIYESILNTFDVTPEQAARVLPEQPQQEVQPGGNVLDRACDKIKGWYNNAAEFIDNHKTASTIGFLGGIGTWLGAKYFAQQKKTGKQQ